MTQSFYDLLFILKKSVFNKEIYIKNLQCEKICQIAMKQDILPLVYPILSKHTPTENKNVQKMFMAQLLSNEQKIIFLKKVVQVFNKNNINYCILKGCAIGELYAMRECRVSGDVDILISPENEKYTMKLLQDEMKMMVTPRSKDSHHFTATHPKGGLFEIHISLYNSMFDNKILKNNFFIKEPPIMMNIRNEFDILTLGLNDNLNFLTAHLIKHFVKEGCGIRQITDLLVYVDKYKDKLDFDEYFKLLKATNFDKLIENIFGIGVKYFDLSLPIYCTDYSDEILTDIEAGGNFGFSDEERKGFYHNFISLRTSSDKRSKYTLFMTIKTTLKILKGIFLPSKNTLLKKGYKYINKSMLLYPIAYINRIIDAFGLLINKKRTLDNFKFKTNENETITKRMNLMKQLDMIGGSDK